MPGRPYPGIGRGWPSTASHRRILTDFQRGCRILPGIGGRPPEPGERRRFEQAVAHFAELHDVPAGSVLKSQAVWRDVAHTLFNLKEFSYIP